MHGDSANTPPHDDDVDPAADESLLDPPSQRGKTSAEDRDIVTRVLANDDDALRSLIDRYDRLVRYAVYRAQPLHCRRDPAWLDARANETWVGVVSSLRRLGLAGLPDSLASYVVQIAKNKAIDALRESESHGVVPLDEAMALMETPSDLATSDDPLAIIENLEQIENLRECMAALDGDDRLLCSEIALITERRWQEAAERLSMPESTLRSRWRAVVGKLRRCLEKKIGKNLAPPDQPGDS